MLAMSDLYVDTAGLRAVEHRLGVVADDLQSCSAALHAASSAGLGDAALEDACSDFAASWSYGTGRLGAAAAAVRATLAEGLQVYTDIEAELASLAWA